MEVEYSLVHRTLQATSIVMNRCHFGQCSGVAIASAYLMLYGRHGSLSPLQYTSCIYVQPSSDILQLIILDIRQRRPPLLLCSYAAWLAKKLLAKILGRSSNSSLRAWRTDTVDTHSQPMSSWSQRLANSRDVTELWSWSALLSCLARSSPQLVFRYRRQKRHIS